MTKYLLIAALVFGGYRFYQNPGSFGVLLGRKPTEQSESQKAPKKAAPERSFSLGKLAAAAMPGSSPEKKAAPARKTELFRPAEDHEIKPVAVEDRPKVILFTGTEWCPACQELDKSVVKTKEWKDFSRREIQFMAVDFPRDRSLVSEKVTRLAQHFEVTQFPTMLVLDKNNREAGRQVGAGAPVEIYQTWIRSLGGR